MLRLWVYVCLLSTSFEILPVRRVVPRLHVLR